MIVDDDVYFNNEERKIMRALQRIFGWMERSLKIEGRGRGVRSEIKMRE